MYILRLLLNRLICQGEAMKKEQHGLTCDGLSSLSFLPILRPVYYMRRMHWAYKQGLYTLLCLKATVLFSLSFLCRVKREERGNELCSSELSMLLYKSTSCSVLVILRRLLLFSSVLGLIITIGEAVAYVISGMYGDIHDLGASMSIIPCAMVYVHPAEG